MELTDRVDRYSLTVAEIIGKLSLEFIGQPQMHLEYDIERALIISPQEAKRLVAEFIEKGGRKKSRDSQ